MFRFLCLCIVWLGLLSQSFAANTHGVPSVEEWKFWFGDSQAAYVKSGCAPAVPSSSLTFGAFACAGYVEASNGSLVYVAQSAVALGPLSGGNGTYWLLLYQDLASSVSGWSRQNGTQYLWQKSSSQPSTPTGGLIFAQVTVTGGVITDVSSLVGNLPFPLQTVTRDIYNVLDYGVKGDCSTNDAIAVQRLANAMEDGGTLYFPQTSGGCYLFGTSRVNITKNVSVVCQNWDTYLSWDTENATDPGCPDMKTCNYGGLNIYDPDVTDGDYLTGVNVMGCHMKFGGARGNTYQLWKRGLNIYQASNVRIEGNFFENVTGEVIGIGNFGSATKGDRSWVVNNYLLNFAQVGINPNNSANTVVGNRLRLGTLAVEMGGSGTIVAYNEAFDLTAAFAAIQTTNSQVVHNTCRTCYSTNPGTTDGVITVNDRGNCQGTSGLRIAGNVLINTAAPANAAGITVYNSGVACSPNRNSMIQVQNNLIGTAFPTGIYIDQCDECQVTDNNVQGATAALAVSTGGTKVLRTSFSGNRLNGTTPIQDQSVLADGNVFGGNYIGTSGNALRLRFGSTLRAWADGDTTPSVAGNVFWSATYTNPTNVTFVDDVEPGSLPACVRFGNGNITLIASGTLRTPGGANLNPGANDVYCFVNDGGGVVYVSGGSDN